jgi:hypothetical protein
MPTHREAISEMLHALLHGAVSSLDENFLCRIQGRSRWSGYRYTVSYGGRSSRNGELQFRSAGA